MFIRREQPADVDLVRAVVAQAFAHPAEPDRVPVEVGLLEELRADDGWLPALSLVAVDLATEEMVGHVVATRGSVDDRPALGIGPLAVRPDQQRRGVGTALMHAVLGAADALDESLVAVLGEPDYYQRFGFRPASTYGVIAPDPNWGDYFQIRAADRAGAGGGTFAYAKPFQRL